MSSRKRMKPLMVAMILLGIAAAVRLVNIFFQLDSPIFQAPVSDEFEHFSLASKLAAGDWLGKGVGPFHRPQLFPYVCAIFFRIFGTSFLVTHAISLMSDLLAIPLWFAIARRAFGRRGAIVGALFVCVHWTFVYFSATGYMESFAMLLNAGFLFALVRFAHQRMRRKSGWNWIIIAAISAGLGILTRPTLIFLMPMFCIMIMVLERMRAKRLTLRGLAYAVAFGAMAMVTISPNAIRHWMMFGLWAPLGTGSDLNFHMSNNRDGWGWERSSPGIEFEVYQMLPVVEGGITELNVTNVRQFWKKRNQDYLREEPLRYARNILYKFLQVCNAREIYCTNDFQYSRSRSPMLRVLPGLWLFIPLAFVGIFALPENLWRTFRTNKPMLLQVNTVQTWTSLLLLGWVVCYLIGVAMFLPIARHRLPAIPPLLLLSGFGFMRLMQAGSPRLIPCIALALGITISQIPVIPKWLDAHERWWTQVNLGVALMKLGEREQAVEELKKGTQILPDKIETWRQLALCDEAMSRHAEAATAQGRALALLRAQYPAYYMIEAQLLADMVRYQSLAQQYDQSIATARELVALVPTSPSAHRTLATALRVAGREAEAQEEELRAKELQRSP